MSLFDQIHETKNHFAKENPDFLKSMFGATDLTPLWIADMDFKIAEPISDELTRLVDRGIYAYEFNSSEVFEALSNWYLKRNNLKLNPKNFIQVTGVLTGLAVLIRELSKEGDSVLVQTPVYHQFFNIIKSANRTILDNPLKVVEGHYQIDFEDLEAKFKEERVSLMILCNPHNPIGRVWTKKEMIQLCTLANQYNVTILSDEIHSDIIYKGSSFTSIAEIDTDNKHVAILGSPAKTFGMHSIAHGYLFIENEAIREKVKQVVSGMYLDHGNTLSSFATLAAYTKGEKWLDELLTYLEETNAWIQQFVAAELPQVKVTKPEGTYQVWLDFGSMNLSEDALKELVVNRAKLALTPGNWFGEGHSNYMRMNIASPRTKIQQAFSQLKTAISIELNKD